MNPLEIIYHYHLADKADMIQILMKLFALYAKQGFLRVNLYAYILLSYGIFMHGS